MLLPLLLSAACAAQDPFGPLERQTPFFTLEISPSADLWSELVYRAGLEGEILEGPLAGATQAARELNTLLASPRMWSSIAGAAIESEPGSWLTRKVVLTKRMIQPGRTRKEVRAGIDLFLAEADTAALTWIEDEWPSREAKLIKRRAALAEALNPSNAEEIWNRIDRWLTLTRPETPYPAFLVTHMTPPGGTTVISSKRAACLVSTEGREVSVLAEVVLHEVIHALETLPGNPPPVFSDILKLLAHYGVRNPKVKNEWLHVVYDIAAAHLVRDVIDPEHVDCLIVEERYAELEQIHTALMPAWTRFTDGLITRKRFCEEVAMAARQARDQ